MKKVALLFSLTCVIFLLTGQKTTQDYFTDKKKMEYHYYADCPFLSGKPIRITKVDGLKLCSYCSGKRLLAGRPPSGTYADVEVGMSKEQVDELLGRGELQSEATYADSHWESVYYQKAKDYSSVIMVTFVNGKVYSKQRIIH